jgi:outer membrane protein assembly factor BamA
MGVVTLGCAILYATLAAQLPPSIIQERLSGLPIEKIEVTAPEGEDTVALIQLTGLAVGRPYSTEDVRRAVKLLYQLDRFENVYISAARISNNVTLEIVLPPRPRIRELRVESAEELEGPRRKFKVSGMGRLMRLPDTKRTELVLSETEIQEAIAIKPGAELDLRELPSKREALQAQYRWLGYRSPAIGIAVERVDNTGGHNMLVRIDPGPRTRLSRARFEGELSRPEWAVASFLGLERGEYLDLRRLEQAIEDLAADYRRRGYYDVAIGEPRVIEHEEEAIDGDPSAELTLSIRSGPHVTVRFLGHSEVSIRELLDAASVMSATEIGAGPAAIAEIKERVLARYERRGFWQAKVDARVRTSPDGKEREIVFAIEEGMGSYIASVGFEGTNGANIEESQLRAKMYEVIEETLADVTGDPGADPETIGATLGDFSLAPEKNRDSSQPDMTSPDLEHVYVPRAYRSAVDALADMYRSEGYQTVVVKPPRVNVRPDGGLVDLVIEVEPGIRWQLGALSFSGNEAMPSSSLLELSKMDPTKQGGEPLSFYNVEETSRAIIAHYRNEGYLYARISEDLREVLPRGSRGVAELVSTSTTGPLDVRRICRDAETRGGKTCDVELVFRVVEGPQVRTRNVIIRGVETTRESLVRGELAVREGEVLRESDMLSTRANLLRVGVFERVAVHPIDEKTEAAEKDVVLEVRERKHSSFELGAGASTAEGVRAFATYAHQNLFGTALRLQVNGKVNVQPFLILYPEDVRDEIEQFYESFTAPQRIERELAAGVAYPQIFGLPRGFGMGLDVNYERNNEPSYAIDGLTLAISGTYTGFRPELLNKQRPVTLRLRSNFDLANLTCNNLSADQTACADQEMRRGRSVYLLGGPMVRFDLRDDALDPHAGAYFELAASYAKGLSSDSPDFVDLEGTASFYLPLAKRVGLAFSFFSARIFNLESALAIPVNRRKFAGGSSTIRGYPERSLFSQDAPPSDPNTVISSGGLFVFSLKNELRFPISGLLSGAVFYDIGDLYEDASKAEIDFQTTRQGIGAGLRFATPVGPLTVDFAVPLVVRDSSSERAGVNLHFSVRSF